MNKSKRKIKVTKEREVNTYAELWHTSHCLLEKCIHEPRGSFHQIMASLVFTAFSLEAYLNHIGLQVFKCWADIERLGPKEKLNLIAERLGVSIDYGRRPWQVMKHLFGFRNDIAHCKSEVVKLTKVLPLHRFSDGQFGKFAQTEWQKYCTQKNAQRARHDVEKIIDALHKVGKFTPSYPFSMGIQARSASVIDE